MNLSVLIGQAGWAAAGIGDDPSYFGTHRWWAWLTVAVCVGSLVTYVVLRRSAGPVLLVLAAVVAVLPLVQIALAGSGLVALHVFVGVLTVMVGTALTSWTYRHTLPSTT